MERLEFIALMNYTHYAGNLLKISKHDGVKCHLIKMGDNTIKDIFKMFLVCSYLLIEQCTNFGVDSGGKGVPIARCVNINQSVCFFGHRHTLYV